MDNHIKRRSNMPIKCAAIYQNRIWISCFLYNALYCYDYADNSMEYLGKFENQDMGDNLHRQIIRYEDKLFFIPIRANGIDVYNIKNRCFEDTIKYGHDKKITNRIAFQISDELAWLFSQNIMEPLYILHTKEKKMEPCFEWEKEISQVLTNDNTCLISASGICSDEKSVYIAIYNKGIILEIGRESLKVRKIFSDDKFHFACINCFDGVLYLTEIGSTEIVQITDGKAINKVENQEIDKVEIAYSGMVSVEKGFLMIPYQLDDFYLLNTKDKILKKTDISFIKENNSKPCFFSWQTYEGNIFLYPARAQSILTVNSQNFMTHKINLRLPGNITDQWILKNRFETHYRSENGILSEADFSLEEYIMLIEKGEREVEDRTKNIGEEIYSSASRE